VLPAPLAQRDQEYLLDVELTSKPLSRRAVERNGVVTLCERPPQLASVRPFGQPSRRTEEPEDLFTPAVHARDGDGARHLPDRIVGYHLEERTRVAAAERIEDTPDVGDGIDVIYRSSGAIVRP
jgi:hypothetical protein